MRSKANLAHRRARQARGGIRPLGPIGKRPLVSLRFNAIPKYFPPASRARVFARARREEP
jgi:hypothetical protein